MLNGNVGTIYRREIASYFTSPIAYIFVCAFLVVMGIFFFLINGFFQNPNPELRTYYTWFIFAFLLLTPPVTMRLWSEEKKSGTIEILMTLPFKSWQVVIGKYLASYTIVVITLVLTLVVPLSVSAVLDLDWGVILSSYVGALLMSAVYMAVGSWASAMTENQIVALLGSMIVLALLVVLGLPPVMETLNRLVSGLGGFLGWFGTYPHYLNFTKGLINPVDVVYSLSLTAFFLILNNFAVEWRKY
ncbi:MAG: ABC transporter permease subunit [Planctomycetes bacterium]|nr:ABC transporter permease subunit [Planctomycetota bacterium]